MTGRLGEWEPVAFLLAWARSAPNYATRRLHVHRPLIPDDDIDNAYKDLWNKFAVAV